jgi:hypothetical protein
MGLRPRWAAFIAVLIAVLCASQVGDAKPRKPRRPPRKPPVVAVTTRQPAVAAPAPPPVVAENALPGTAGWLGPDATGRAAEVYASATDALPGDTVALHVSTEPGAMYRVLVYRLGWYGGVGARQVACLPSCSGARQGTTQPMPAPDGDGRVVANWPTTDSLTIGSSWVSGYYLVRVLLVNGSQAGASATTYVIVNAPASTSHMLVQVPVNTWQAYNGWGGKSLYPFSLDGTRALRVSFDRPFDWHGTGAQSPLAWELPLIRFIEREGYDVSYQSDVATDANPSSLLTHRVLVDAGHDEYWSGKMRDAWEAARASGESLAFMGANDSYWQVAMENGGRTVMSYKSSGDPNPDPSARTTLFRALQPPRLECDLMGVQHQGGPLNWSDGGYVVQPDGLGDPWLRGTGFRAGDTVPGIVSREVDTIPGTASRASSCGHELTVFFHRENGGDGAGNADAVRYTTPAGSTVFAAGSLNFGWGLDDMPGNSHMIHGLADARLQRFAHNMFAAMGAY